MVVGSNPVAVTSPSDFAPASSKEFLDIQATIECGFTLKRVRDMIKTYSHKESCLIINGKQSVKLKSDSIRFKNYFKQLAVPFKVYADFECLLKRIPSNDKNNSSCKEKCQHHIPCSFAYKVACIDNKFRNFFPYKGKKMQFIDSLKQFLKSMSIVKK